VLVGQRYSLISYINTRKIWVLEKAVVWLLILLSQQNGDTLSGVVASGLRLYLLAAFKSSNVTSVFVLNSTLNIFSARNVLDFNSFT
jgi:hypothetical protein